MAATTSLQSYLRAAVSRPGYPLRAGSLPQALQDAEELGIEIEPTPWSDVHRAWTLAQGSLRYTGTICVAAAERHGTGLITSDARIERSGAPIKCQVITLPGHL